RRIEARVAGSGLWRGARIRARWATAAVPGGAAIAARAARDADPAVLGASTRGAADEVGVRFALAVFIRIQNRAVRKSAVSRAEVLVLAAQEAVLAARRREGRAHLLEVGRA